MSFSFLLHLEQLQQNFLFCSVSWPSLVFQRVSICAAICFPKRIQQLSIGFHPIREYWVLKCVCVLFSEAQGCVQMWQRLGRSAPNTSLINRFWYRCSQTRHDHTHTGRMVVDWNFCQISYETFSEGQTIAHTLLFPLSLFANTLRLKREAGHEFARRKRLVL